MFSGLFLLIWFDVTGPIFAQFLVVTKWLTGKKWAKKRAKWLPNRITGACFLAPWRGVFPASSGPFSSGWFEKICPNLTKRESIESPSVQCFLLGAFCVSGGFHSGIRKGRHFQFLKWRLFLFPEAIEKSEMR